MGPPWRVNLMTLGTFQLLQISLGGGELKKKKDLV